MDATFYVFQVTQALPAMGETAVMGSEGPPEWQEFLVYLVPQGLLVLLDSVSRLPVPCRLVSELLVKALTSDQFRATQLLQKLHLGKSFPERPCGMQEPRGSGMTSA